MTHLGVSFLQVHHAHATTIIQEFTEDNEKVDDNFQSSFNL